MALRWLNAISEPSHEELQFQQALSNSLRRILMLAVDPYPSEARPSRPPILLTPQEAMMHIA
jgi:hypothetical protein